jgi:succinate-semialdehyde dehydrogenase/glutarate-semialdehyde dehydrogenase
MGNAVIIKPASDNPLTDIRLTELLLESGVPGSVAQVITGSGSTVGNHLVASPKIDAVSLTGSTEVGINVAETAAKHLHHVMLELGGNDAMIVFEDADLDLAVKEVIMSRASCAGQICASTKRLIVQNTIKQQFTDMLVKDLGKMRVGNPLDEQMDIGCLINEKAAINVENQIKSTIEKGAVCVLGGKRFDRTFVEPTILVNVTADMDITKDMEVFGPVFPIIGFDTFDEAIQIANSSLYGLMGAVMTRDVKKAMKAAASMECGGVVINGSGRYRPAEFPFGGYKMSGLGREGISTSLEEMSQQKAIVLKGVL